VSLRLHSKVFPAVPVPFARTGVIDEELQGEYVRWMSGQGAGGVAVWAHTGRGLLLHDDERALVLSSWRSGIGDKQIICGVGVPADVALPYDPNHRTNAVCRAAQAMAYEAKRGKADALLVYPPTSLRGLPDLNQRIIDYHKALGEVGLPFLAFYLYDGAGGLSYEKDVLDAFCSLKNFVGIKVATLDSVMTFQDVVARVSARRGVVVTGEDRFLGYSFEMGASAALIGLAAAATDQPVELARSWFGRDYAAFHRLSPSIDAFARSTFCVPIEGYVQRMLWVLEADGALSRRAYDRHAPPLAPAERTAVFEALLALRAA